MLFAKISHEFKTPLNSIIGMTNLIKDSDPQSLSIATNIHLDMISDLSNYVIFLVSDIIQYVNLQDLEDINDLKVNISELDFNEMMTFCFQILQSLLFSNKSKSDNISTNIYVDPEASDFTAESDEIRIKQVILNFISNAVKFTKNGKIELECKKVEIENIIFIKICISDTGIGIKEEEKTLLFKDFGMIDNEFKVTHNKFGTGLGLSLSQSIIERLGFKLQFESEFMKGSKFSILIPCKKKIKSDRKLSRKALKNYDELVVDNINNNNKNEKINSPKKKAVSDRYLVSENNDFDNKSVYILRNTNSDFIKEKKEDFFNVPEDEWKKLECNTDRVFIYNFCNFTFILKLPELHLFNVTSIKQIL